MNLTTLDDINRIGNNEQLRNQSPPIKMYYYEIEFGGYDNYAFNSNAITVAYIKQKTNSEKKFLIKNEEKLKNICNDCNILSEDQIEKIKQLSNNDGSINENDGILEVILTDTFMGNVLENRNNGLKSKLKMLNKNYHTFVTNKQIFDFEKDNFYIFTFEPIDLEKFNAGKQEVYICEKNVPNKFLQRNPDYDDDLKNIEEIIIKESKNFGEFVYTLVPLDQLNTLENATWYLTYGTRPEKVNFIQVNHDRSFAQINVRVFGDAFVKGEQVYFNEEVDVNKYPSHNINYKFTPFSFNQGLTGYSPTWDWNKNLPPLILKNFISSNGQSWKPSNIKNLIVTTNEIWKQTLYQILLTMIKLTRAYTTSFGEYQIKDQNSNQLIYDPKASIGRIRTIGQLTNLDPLSVISSLISEWKITYPLNVQTNEYKIFNAFVLGLNNYIVSQLNINNGGNRLNVLYNNIGFQLNTTINKDFQAGEPCIGKGNDCDPAIEPFKLDKLDDIRLDIDFSSILYPDGLDSNNTQRFTSNYNYFLNSYMLNLDGLIPFATIPEQLSNNDLISFNFTDLPNRSEEISKYWVDLRNYEYLNTNKFLGFNSYPLYGSEVERTQNGSFLIGVGVGTEINVVIGACQNKIISPTVFYPDRKPDTSREYVIYLIIQNLPTGTKLKRNPDGSFAVSEVTFVGFQGIKRLESSRLDFGLRSCFYTLIDYWTASFTYTTIEVANENTLALGNLQQTLNRQGIINLHKELLPPYSNEFKYKNRLNDRNITLSIDDSDFLVNPKEIRLNGFYGERFKIGFSTNNQVDKENIWETEYIEFPSKFDETKILTTIYV